MPADPVATGPIHEAWSLVAAGRFELPTKGL